MRIARAMLASMMVLFGACGVLLAADQSVAPANTKAPDAAAGRRHLVIYTGQSNVSEDHLTLNAAVAKLKEAFADDKFAVVQERRPGQPILGWLKEPKLPDEAALLADILALHPGKKEITEKDKARVKRTLKNYYRCGIFHGYIMKDVQRRLGTKKPDLVTIFWMQGESEGLNSPSQAALYAENLTRLFAQWRAAFAPTEVNVVLGRISDARNGWARWDLVRKSQVEVADADPRCAWVDTDDLNDTSPTSKKRSGDGIHYPGWGKKKLGERFGEKAVELIRNDGKKTEKPPKDVNDQVKK